MMKSWALQSEWPRPEGMQPGNLTSLAWCSPHSAFEIPLANVPSSLSDHKMGSVMCNGLNLRGVSQRCCHPHLAS